MLINDLNWNFVHYPAWEILLLKQYSNLKIIFCTIFSRIPHIAQWIRRKAKNSFWTLDKIIYFGYLCWERIPSIRVEIEYNDTSYYIRSMENVRRKYLLKPLVDLILLFGSIPKLYILLRKYWTYLIFYYQSLPHDSDIEFNFQKSVF